MNLLSFSVLLVICMSHVSYAMPLRSLLGGGIIKGSSSTGASSDGGGPVESSASLQLTTNGGIIEGKSEANATSYAEAESVFVNSFTKIKVGGPFKEPYQPEEEYCVDAVIAIKEEVIAMAYAAAKVFASAFTRVSIIGSGSGCAKAAAEAETAAQALAGVMVKAILDAEVGVTKSEADTAVTIVNEVLVQAFADAEAYVCATNDSSGTAYQDSFAEALAKPIAAVTIYLFTGIDCTGYKSFGNSVIDFYSEPDATLISGITRDVDLTGGATGDATGDAGGSVSEPCTGKYEACCKDYMIEAKLCGCYENDKCYATYQRNIWNDATAGIKCFCS